jgi:hypothetical protein
VVEFSLVAMALIPMMLYSLYFVDLAKARLKTAEIARYAVWEMTSYPLSDYQAKNHDQFFQSAATAVAGEIEARYGEDLRSDTVNGTPGSWPTVDFTLRRVQIANQEARLVPNPEAYNSPGGEVVGSILNGVSGGINSVLGFWGFNTKGQARASVTLQTEVKRAVIPEKAHQDFFQADLLPNTATRQTFTESYTMIVDSWTLFDGEDVYPWGGYSKGGTDSIYYQQLKRVVWMGAANIPILGSIGNLLSKLNTWFGNFVDVNPFQARLASIGSRGVANNANKVPINVDCGEGKNSPGIHSTPIRYTFGAYTDSEYVKTYNKRGNWHMGCPTAQKLPGKCDWPNN